MPSVVLDVNVIVAGFFQGKGAAVAIARHWERGDLNVAISIHIIDQVLEVWTRPFFATRAAEVDRALAVRLMQSAAELFEPDPSVRGVCDDGEDDLVLGTAVAAEADYLVTGDKGFLRIEQYRGVWIVSAAEFLVLIRQELEPDT